MTPTRPSANADAILLSEAAAAARLGISARQLHRWYDKNAQGWWLQVGTQRKLVPAVMNGTIPRVPLLRLIETANGR